MRALEGKRPSCEVYAVLARRAVASPTWRQMPGMSFCDDDGDLPDLTDPATQGCLLALVREKYGTVVTFYDPTQEACLRWDVEHHLTGTISVGSTEIEALIRALEKE